MERKVKNKKCKECGGNFTPFKTTQVVCGAKCAAKLAETKVWKEKKKAHMNGLLSLRKSGLIDRFASSKES